MASRQHLQTVKETAEYLGVSVRTVRSYIADGRVKAVRLGPRMVRVEKESVDALMRPIGM